MEAATDLVVYLLAFTGVVYLSLTAVVLTGDSRRRREQRERLEAQEWRDIVDSMRRMEQQHPDDAA
jgi:thiosulfate reductase cytochrome b subunit